MHFARNLKLLIKLVIYLFFLLMITCLYSCQSGENIEPAISTSIQKEDVAQKTEESRKEENEIIEGTSAREKVKETKEEVVGETMKIESTAFGENEMIPSKYTCDGQDISPPLKISGVPADARSLVLIVDDPDAPGKAWVHWTVWNIDPKINNIEENSVPQGAVEGTTDFGSPGYGGPCPPSGTHRYFFKVYALDKELDIEPQSTVKDINSAMKGHILDSAELIGLYEKS